MVSRKTRFDSERKKAEIMQKATKLFLEKGFELTSINDICWSAKITKPSLYHYFESKNHLLFSIHMKTIENILHPYMKEAMTVADPEQRLRMMIREYVKIICSHPELRFILHESLSIKDKYFSEIRNQWKKHYILVRDTISELQSTGKIHKELNTSRTALLLFGMITWITYWFNFKIKDHIDEIADLAVRIAFEGIWRIPTCNKK